MRHSLLIPALLAAGLAADASAQGIMLRRAEAPAPATKPQEPGKAAPLQLARIRRAAPQGRQGLPKDWEARVRRIVRQEVRAAINEALAQRHDSDGHDGRHGPRRGNRQFRLPTMGFATPRFSRVGAPFGGRFDVFFSDDDDGDRRDAKKGNTFFRWEAKDDDEDRRGTLRGMVLRQLHEDDDDDDDDDDQRGKGHGFMVIKGDDEGHKVVELQGLHKQLENMKVKMGELQLHIVGERDAGKDVLIEVEEVAPEIRIERIKRLGNLKTRLQDFKSNRRVELTAPQIHVERTGLIRIVGPDGRVKELKIGGDGVKGTLKLDGGVWRVEDGEKPVKSKKKRKASLRVRKKKTTII